MTPSYLRDRYFYVEIENNRSNIYKIEPGVRKGSVLSPVVYAIFTSNFKIADNILTAVYPYDKANPFS